MTLVRFAGGFALVLLAASASAQTGAPTSWTLRIYAQGAPTALSSVTVQASQVQCNQAPDPVTAPLVNPDVWEWNDVVLPPGRVCLYRDASRLQSLPDGAYEGTVQAVNTDGPSAEGPRVPFTRLRPNPPAVPTGLRIIRQATP